MDYHTVYRNASPQSTEWEDIHRRLGNLPPVEDRPEAPPIHAALDASQIVKDQDWIGRHRGDEEELARLEDEGIVTDDRALENYRRKRLEELKQGPARPQFGKVETIEASEFVPEVSQAGPDQWVLVHLFKHGNDRCELLSQCLDWFAPKYSEIKCVKIISTDCIPGYPDNNLPTLLVYRNTDVVHSFVGLNPYNGMRTTPEDLERVLQQVGVCSETVMGSHDAKLDASEQARRMFAERLLHSAREESDLDSDFSE